MSHDAAERALVVAWLDTRADQFADVRAQMTSAVDRLKESWNIGADLAGHEQRMASMRDETKNFLADVAGGEPVQGQVGATTAGAAPATSGPGPGQPNPREIELAEADRIRGLSLQASAAERDQLIRATRPRGMFG